MILKDAPVIGASGRFADISRRDLSALEDIFCCPRWLENLVDAPITGAYGLRRWSVVRQAKLDGAVVGIGIENRAIQKIAQQNCDNFATYSR